MGVAICSQQSSLQEELYEKSMGKKNKVTSISGALPCNTTCNRMNYIRFLHIINDSVDI